MDTVFFIASKIIWGLIGPESWLFIGLALVALGLFLGRRRLAGWSLGLTLGFALSVAILPLGDIAMRPLEERYPIPDLPQNVTGIIVLGGAEDGIWTVQGPQVRFNEGAERFTEGLRLAKLYPDAKLLFSGGIGAVGNIEAIRVPPEQTTAGVFFLEQGIPAAQMVIESASRNTAENARLSYDMMQPKPGETWILVTSAFHMERSLRTFRAAGWTEILPWPVDFRARPFAWGVGWNFAYNLRQLNVAMKEYIGLLAYGLTGR
ncbi:YdcF family protein [Pseudogemmobacter bohemicus]|uniref:YdcF family protein n=1 Tax=Pseudogemmobacter bohemicus TaxID=2250708 RepID=UPI000DD42AC1|nr:YdcF family protein [Pseudogemmobacter bohemicus]